MLLPEVVEALVEKMRAFRSLQAGGGLVESTEPPAGWSAPEDWAITDG